MPDNETRSIDVKGSPEGVSELAYSAQRWDEHMREHELVSAWTAKELSAALLAAQAVQGSVKEQLDTYKVSHAREHELIAQAVQIAKDATDVRLAGVNEFRAQLSDQALTFVRVDVVEAKFNAMGARLDALDKSVGERLAALEKFMNSQQGRSGGSAATIAYIIAAISALATIVSLFLVFSGK